MKSLNIVLRLWLVVNLLKLDEGESIQTIINVDSERSDDAYFLHNSSRCREENQCQRICKYSVKMTEGLNLKDEIELINAPADRRRWISLVPSLVMLFVLIISRSWHELYRDRCSRSRQFVRGDTVVGASVITNQDEVLSSLKRYATYTCY